MSLATVISSFPRLRTIAYGPLSAERRAAILADGWQPSTVTPPLHIPSTP